MCPFEEGILLCIPMMCLVMYVSMRGRAIPIPDVSMMEMSIYLPMMCLVMYLCVTVHVRTVYSYT